MIYSGLSPRQAEAVTPSDTADLARGECTEFWVGVAGDVKYTPAGQANPVTLKNMAAGGYRLAAKRFYNTGTTATDLVAFYG